VLSEPISMDEYVEQAVDGLLSTFGGYVGIGHSRIELLGQKAGVVEYDAGGLVGTQYLLMKGGLGFVLTCTASLDQAELYAPVFEQIARSFQLFLPEEAPTPTPAPPTGPEEIDLGTIAYYEAPQTWSIDIPEGFTRVEIGIYGKGSTTVNKYGGWDAWLNVNDKAVWEFERHDDEQGGVIYDHTLGQQVLEKSGKEQYLDATTLFHAGANTLIYYHFTDTDFGVKVRVWRAGAPTPTPTPLPRPTATPTPTPTPTPTRTPTPTPTRTPTPLPDLVPYRPSGWSAPLVYHGTPMAGVPLSIDFAIKNTASVYAKGRFEVAILVDGSPASRLILPELARGADYRKTGAEVTVEEPGSHLIELVVDWQDEVREADETNNSYAREITWAESHVQVTRLAWLDSGGTDVIQVHRGATVTLLAEVSGLDDRILTVGIYEVDPLDPDDLIEWVEMQFVGGHGRATWTAVWIEDGPLELGGNPEYKFVVLGIDSPELEVR